MKTVCTLISLVFLLAALVAVPASAESSVHEGLNLRSASAGSAWSSAAGEEEDGSSEDGEDDDGSDDEGSDDGDAGVQSVDLCGVCGGSNACAIFIDDFETGDSTAWSNTVP